jgi:hypothetical protein
MLRLITWKFQAGNVKHRSNYMYTNDPDYLTAEERARGGREPNSVARELASGHF